MEECTYKNVGWANGVEPLASNWNLLGSFFCGWLWARLKINNFAEVNCGIGVYKSNFCCSNSLGLLVCFIQLVFSICWNGEAIWAIGESLLGHPSVWSSPELRRSGDLCFGGGCAHIEATWANWDLGFIWVFWWTLPSTMPPTTSHLLWWPVEFWQMCQVDLFGFDSSLWENTEAAVFNL